MTKAEVIKLLKSFSYKDEFEFSWRFKNKSSVEITGIRKAIDSRKKSKTRLTHTISINFKQMDSMGIILTLFTWVQRAEYHEMCEFFKIGGKMVMDPHLSNLDGL